MSKFVLTAQLKLQAPNNVNSVLGSVRKQLQGVKIPVEVEGAKKAQDDLKKISKQTQKATTAAAGLGKSFGLAAKRFAAFTVASRTVSLFTNTLAKATTEAIDFQREIVKVAQVTGKTVKELRSLQNTITQLSIGLGTSSKDLLAVTRILSQAGIKANDLETALESLAKTTLAPTFDDITETAEGAVAILSQFGQGVEKLESQLGAINAVAGQFAVESGDLIGAVRRFGGVFQAAGGELEELLAVFTAVRATTRESAESISTGLRTIFTRIQRPKTIEFLKQFGVELENLDGSFVGPFEAAKRLSEALAGLGKGDLQFIQIAEELGGFRQIGKVIPLLQQFAVAERARQAALAGGDSLTKDAETAQQALAVQIVKVKEEFLALVRAVAESSSFQLFAKLALEIASNLIKIADAVKPLIPLIGALAAIKLSKGIGEFFAGAGSAVRGVQSFDPQKKNLGGKILAFNRGGFVPGTGNRDTVPAMLTPGEFVIKKSSVKKLGGATLEAMNQNRYAEGDEVEGSDAFSKIASGEEVERRNKKLQLATGTLLKKLGDKDGNAVLDVAGAFLQSKGSVVPNLRATIPQEAIIAKAQETVGIPKGGSKPVGAASLREAIGVKGSSKKGIPVNVRSGILSEDVAKEFQGKQQNRILQAARETAENKIGIDFDDAAFLNAYKNVNIEQIEGGLFEALIAGIANKPFDDEKISANANFDFPKGVGAAAEAFGIAGDIIADAKRTYDPASIDSIVKKASNALLNNMTVQVAQDLVSAGKAKGPQQKIAEGELQGLNRGGIASGSDTVPALLTPGEFVVNKKSAQSIGYGNLKSMNKTGVARFANGGVVGFQDGGSVPTRKSVKAEIATGQAGLTDEIAGLAGEISKQRKTVQQATKRAQQLSDEEALLAKKSANLSDAVLKLEKEAKPGAKGQKALNRIYAEIEKVEQERLKVEKEAIKSQEGLTRVEEELKSLQQEKADKIAQARTQKEFATEAAQESLTSGDQAGEFNKSKVAELQRSQDEVIKRNRGIANATKNGAKQMKLLTTGLVTAVGALGLIKPTIDENSSALARITEKIIGGFQNLLNVAIFVVAALKTFGIELNAKGIGQFLKGKGGGFDAVSDALGKKFKSVGNKVSQFGKGLGGKTGSLLQKFGGGLSSSSASLGTFAAGAATAAAAVAASVVVTKAAVEAIDAYTKVHEKAKEAVEKGDTARAGDAAVASANAKLVNKAAIGIAAGGAAIGFAVAGPLGAAVGGLIGVVGGLALKFASFIPGFDKVLNGIRDNFLVLFTGVSTQQIKERAELDASVNKAQKDLALNGRKAANALRDVENGTKSFEQAFSDGSLTGNLENAFDTTKRAAKLQATIIEDNKKVFFKKGFITDSAKAIGSGQGTGADVGRTLFSTLNPVFAVGAELFGKDIEKANKDALAERVKVEEQASAEISKGISDVLPRLVQSRFRSSGGDERAVRESILSSGPFAELLKKSEATVKQLEAIKKERDLTADEQKLLDINQANVDEINSTLDGALLAAKRQAELVKALNFGLAGVADRLAATNRSLSKLANIDQLGNQFEDALLDLETAFSTASTALTDGELDGAIGTLGKTLKDAGLDDKATGRITKQARSFATAQGRLNTDSAAIANIRKLAQDPNAGDIDFRDDVAKEITKGLDDETKRAITAAIQSAEFGDAELNALAAGSLEPILKAVGTASDKFSAETLKIVQERAKAENTLVATIKNRQKAEDEFVAAQRKAIDLQLEAGAAFAAFGGAALTPEQRRSANLAKFNTGAGVAGIRGLQSGDASEIARVGADIANGFNALEQSAKAGAVTGVRAFAGGAGAEADQRERLKALQQDLIATTQAEIQARKDELDLIKRKNAAEKDSLEKLLGGDVAGFLEGQATAGAAAALRTGDSGLTSLFSSSALGSGLKALEGQGLSDAQLRTAGELSLASVGVRDTRAAGVLTGTTSEEQAIKAEGRELSQTLGALGQQAAEFERLEVQTKQVIVNAAQLELSQLAAPVQQRALGGPIYASRGMFVPRGTDTVPAMLTPGEFVVNRSAVNRGNNLQILRAMNQGGGASAPGAMSGGGKVQYYNFGGLVDGIGEAIGSAIPGLQGVFSGFTDAVDKLINSQFSVKLDTTNVNVNFNGGSFLASMKEDIRNELLKEVQTEIGKFKPNTNGDLQKTDSVLGN